MQHLNESFSNGNTALNKEEAESSYALFTDIVENWQKLPEHDIEVGYEPRESQTTAQLFGF